MRGVIKYSRPADLLDWDGLLNRFFDDTPVWKTAKPAVDIRENDQEYLMEVEIPGLSEKDVELKVEENLLTISSRQEEEKEESKNGYLMQERRHSEFARSFVLPREADREKISAGFKNGLLTVTLPKVPKAQPKLIEVKKK